MTSATPRAASAGTTVAATGTTATSGGHVPHVSSSDVDTTGVGPIVETAIQRSPILYIRSGFVATIILTF